MEWIRYLLYVVIVAVWLSFHASKVDANLLAYYPFEDYTTDATGHGYNGIPKNAPLHIDHGHSGYAYWFDGRDDYIELPLSFDPQNPPSITIGAWVNFGFIPNQGNQGIKSNATWSALTTTGTNPTTNVMLNEWTFIAASYDSQMQTILFYVNGQTFPINGIIDLGSGPLRIGSFYGLDNYFLGAIDDVFIYDEPLTKEDLDAIMTYGINPVPLPGSMALLASGLWYLLWCKKRRFTRLLS